MALDNPIFVGIDVGTSAVKVIAIDSSGEVVATKSTALTLQTPRPGWAE